MKIRPGDIGNFKSLTQADAYQRAMEVKNRADFVANKLEQVDNADGIDFNDAVYGSVLVKDMETKDGRFYTRTSGEVRFDPGSGELERLKADYKTFSQPFRLRDIKKKCEKGVKLGFLGMAVMSHNMIVRGLGFLGFVLMGHNLFAPGFGEDFNITVRHEKTLFGHEKEVYIEESSDPSKVKPDITKKVTIDKKTGDIDYREFNSFGIPLSLEL